MSAQITGMTVSVSIANKDYGNGSETFANLSAKWPDNENPSLEDVMEQGLAMYFTLWQQTVAARCMTGDVKGSEFKRTVAQSLMREKKVINVLRTLQTSNDEQLNEMLERITKKEQ